MECLGVRHGLLCGRFARLVLRRSPRLHSPCPVRVFRSFTRNVVSDNQLTAFPQIVDTPDPMKGIGTLKERIGDRSQEVASNSKPLEEVQQKNKQLRAILQRLAWPRLGFFTVHGITHNLPWPPKLKLLSAEQGPAIRTLRYLSGFFDGDGCVTCSGSLSGCTLSVRQSYDKAEVLVLLCKTFGGRVYKGQDGLGLRKPLLDWVICGAPARRCANLLAIHSIVKKKQLLLAASWPDDARRRPDCKASLHSLKLCDSAVAGPCTWEYVAGFFDAEGCLQLYNRSTLRLAIKQKFATVLHCLQEFLVESCDAGANIYAGNGYFALYISRTSACKTVLQIMLDAGLLIKKQNAELALNTTHENAAKVRLTLAELVGNQMFGRRLDDAGMNRARKISANLSRIRGLNQRGKKAEAAAAFRDVQEMKLQHHLLNALHENQCLTEYICRIQSLSGAQKSAPA